MKPLLFLVLIGLMIGCSTTKKSISSNYNLNGTWRPTYQELAGVKLPETIFETQQLILEDSLYTLSVETIDKGILQYQNGKMDIYGKEGPNAGLHFTAIYKLENDQLTICYNLKGDAYPTSFETNSSSTLFMSVFKKQ